MFFGMGDDIRAKRELREEELKRDFNLVIPKIGQHVLVDAQVLGMGLTPLEAKVLRVQGSIYELEFIDYRKFGSDEPERLWVMNWCVLEVLPEEK